MDNLTRCLVAASPEAMLVSNGGGRVLLANPAAAALTRRPVDELIGLPFTEVLDPTLSALVRRTVDETSLPIDHLRSSKGALRRPDGRLRRVETTVARLELNGHPAAALYLRPVPHKPTPDELTAFRQVIDAVVADGSPDEILDVAARSARELFAAEGASIVRLDEATASVEVVAACGSLAGFLGARVLLEGTRVQAATEQGVPVRYVDGGLLQQRGVELPGPSFGELWIAPITVDGETFGALNVSTTPGRHLPAEGFERLPAFVDVLTLAIELSDATRHRSALALVADHERIARDLHDVVIQRLIASAMRLESMLLQVDDVHRGRLCRVIDDLDRVARDIRSTVFDLQRDDDRSDDLVRLLRDLTESTGEAFGLRTSCHVDAVVDHAVPDGLRTHLLAVTREALSNVGRHAHATQVSVVVRLDDPLVLTVTDDGCGLARDITAGNGLHNIEARAHELRGMLSVQAAHPTGTVLRWEIPWPSSVGTEPESAASL